VGRAVLSSILSQGILNGSIYALVGIGLGLTYGKQNVIDVANPAFVIVGSYLVLALSQYFALDPFIVTPLALVALFLAGVAVQFLLVNPLLKRPDFEMHVQSALVLFGLALLLQTLLVIQFTADPQGIRTAYSDSVITLFGVRLPVVKVIATILALTAVAALYTFLNLTFIGKAILATYANRETAQLLGINVKRIDVVTYGLGTALAGIAGLVIALTYSFSSASVQPWTVIAFAVAVIGGKGSTTGILVAGLTVGFVEAAVAATFSANWIYLAVYTLLLLMFLFRPSGILGERA
jgi:branched-chain amino acid transport system permease protein